MINLILISTIISSLSAQIFNGAQQIALLKSHNDARAKVFNSTGAANPPLVWNANLATCALYWANQMLNHSAISHSDSTTMPGGTKIEFISAGYTYSCNVPSGNAYGENLFWSSSTAATHANATKLWLNESYAYHEKYRNESISLSHIAEYGHYTQMVGKVTTSVGCATAKKRRFVAVVCQYFKSANLLGKTITDVW